MNNSGFQTLYLKKEAFVKKERIGLNNRSNQKITQFDFNQIKQNNSTSLNNSKLKPLQTNENKNNILKSFLNTSMQTNFMPQLNSKCPFSSFNIEQNQNKIQQFKEFKLDQKVSSNLVQYFQQQKKILPKLTNNIPTNNIWGYSRAGKIQNRSKINQDRLLIDESNDFKLYGVFDGHGEQGHFVSQFIKEGFQNLFRKNGFLVDETYKERIYEIFLELKSILQNQDFDSDQSGSTVVLSIMQNNHIITANLGDSRALICSQQTDKFHVKQLTVDQKPELPEERSRIESMGGFVHQYRNIYGQPLGPFRVWNAMNLPGLAMARSMGDFLYNSIGISNIPDISVYQIQPEDKILIWISDGVHQYLSNEKIMNIVKPFYLKKQAKQACLQLMQIAKQKWQEVFFIQYKQDQYVDDITAIVYFLD